MLQLDLDRNTFDDGCEALAQHGLNLKLLHLEAKFLRQGCPVDKHSFEGVIFLKQLGGCFLTDTGNARDVVARIPREPFVVDELARPQAVLFEHVLLGAEAPQVAEALLD